MYFNSFEELNRELEIRKTEAEIDRLKLLRHYGELRRSMAPNNWLVNVGFSMAQNFLVGKLLKRIIPFLK